MMDLTQDSDYLDKGKKALQNISALLLTTASFVKGQESCQGLDRNNWLTIPVNYSLIKSCECCACCAQPIYAEGRL